MSEPPSQTEIIACQIANPFGTPVYFGLAAVLSLVTLFMCSWLFMTLLEGALAAAASLVYLGAVCWLTYRAWKLMLSSWGETKYITLNDQFIQFQDYWSKSLYNRIKREWSDLHSVQYNGDTNTKAIADWLSMANSSLTLDFKSGGSAIIPFSGLDRASVEKLFLLLERYSDQSVFSKRALLFERSLMSVDDVTAIEYDQLWTDALDSQFAATQFVPLATGAEMQSGRYQIRMQLASNGYSAVYLGKQGSNKVILKESVTPAGVDNQSLLKAKELFEREARLLARVDHPNIARVLDHFVENERDYIVLQFVPGTSLRQIVTKEGPQPSEKVMNWALQIASILKYLHGLDPPIIHRDLTPDNLLLTGSGSIVLIDFGVSNEFVSTATGTLVGKQAYIPIEQFRGKADLKSDIFAYGATIFFLLTGRDPEPLSTSRPRLFVKDVPEPLDILVTECTEMQAERRPDAIKLEKCCREMTSTPARSK